jgi:hypothetical protein
LTSDCVEFLEIIRLCRFRSFLLALALRGLIIALLGWRLYIAANQSDSTAGVMPAWIT